jgi:DNA-binding transcriptional ArsR family regulator
VDALELLAHPVRLRIVHAMRGNREFTTGQLCARLPDVSKAMVYRHVDLLATEGILEVTGERRVRGAVERVFRLNQERAAIDAETFLSMSPEDHRRGFSLALAVLVAEFSAYLERGDCDPAADLVGYRQHAIWLSRDELTRLISGLREAILPVLDNPPRRDRMRYLLSPILFPVEESPEDARGAGISVDTGTGEGHS